MSTSSIQRFAPFILVGLMVSAIVFHLLVVAGTVPMNMVWGGRISNRDELLIMEAQSITLLFVISILISLAAGWWGNNKDWKGYRYILWVLSGIFVLNTVGNLFSLTTLETYIFTPITAVAAVLFGWWGYGK